MSEKPTHPKGSPVPLETWPPVLAALKVTGYKLKAPEITLTLTGVTNVENLATLTPEAWARAMFDFLLDLHGDDYRAFRETCTLAVETLKADRIRAAA